MGPWGISKECSRRQPRPSSRERRPELGHPVDEDRPISLEVVGQQDEGRVLGEPDGGDPRPHRIDREHHFAAEDLAEEREIFGHVTARHVQEVEAFEGSAAARLGHYAAMAASALGTVSSGVTGDQARSIRPSSSTRKEERRIPKYVWPPRCFSTHVPHAVAIA